MGLGLDSFKKAASATAGIFGDAGKSFGTEAMLFGEGVYTGALQNPVNGVGQIVNKVTGANLPVLELPNQDRVNSSWAGKAGIMTGTLIDAVATNGALSNVSLLANANLMRMAATGAIQQGILTPGDDSGSGLDFFLNRGRSAAQGAAMFATMAGVGGKVSTMLGPEAASTFTGKVVANGLGGGAGGAVETTVSSLFDRRLPGPQALATSIATNTAFGAGFGALGFAAERVAGGSDASTASPYRDASGRKLLNASDVVKLPDGTRVDRLTAYNLKSNGLTPDSYVYRITQQKFLKGDGTIEGNPSSVAQIVADAGFRKGEPAYRVHAYAGRVGSGLNISTEPLLSYARPGDVLIRMRVGDLLGGSGRIYQDDGAVAGLGRALYATFNGSVPFTLEGKFDRSFWLSRGEKPPVSREEFEARTNSTKDSKNFYTSL